MTAIVTGATGFIGTHLVNALAAAGEDVHCLTRGQPRADGRPNVSFYHADFARADLGLGTDIFANAGTVFHLAGATRAVSPAAFREANVALTERLAERVASVASAARFIYVSSQAAAGPARDAAHPRTETDPEAPIEDYGRSKLAAERAVRERMPDAVVLRPVAVYGPGDRDFLSVFSMVKRGVAIYPGTRNSIINTIFVQDLVHGMLAASRAPGTAERTYFVGDDAPCSWKEIYRVIAEITAQARPVEISVPQGVVALAGAVGDVIGSLSGRALLMNSSKATLAAPRYWLCSSARAREDFRLSVPTSLREGMQVTYDWYVRHRWL